MNQTEQLNELFTKWEQSKPEYKGFFIRDGIIDEDSWNAPGNRKILFIAKEANSMGEDHSTWNPEDRDFRNWWKRPIKYAFSYRVAEWAYGLMNDFPQFDNIYDNENWSEFYSKTLRSIAFMDVKKTAGSGRADNGIILKHIHDDLSFIHEQIEIIKPQLIVSSLVDYDLVNALFGTGEKIEMKKSGYLRCVFSWKGIRVIDFYHPSGQSSPAASYSLLQNIARSNAFQTL